MTHYISTMADTTRERVLQDISEKASEDEKSLPFMEKLQLLDQEIRLLQECCQKLGLDNKEIEFCAEPLLKEQRTEKRKKWWTNVFYISFVVAFIAFILWYEPTYRYICIFGKLSSMKLLPYWDWTTEFEKDCFIENPYYVDDSVLTEEDCEMCRNISGSRLTNISQDVMANRYLFNAIPVVVTDATNDWPVNVHDLDLNSLKEIYLDIKHVVQPGGYCAFDAFNADIESPHQLFSLVQDKKLDNWQGYWENCEPATAKSIRKFYRRPYFLPPMAEAAAENWIFAADAGGNNEAETRWEHVTFGASATWITQIKGQSQIVLNAVPPCDKICKKMSATLKAGETLVFVNRIWTFKRRPQSGGVSISLASTVGWDQI